MLEFLFSPKGRISRHDIWFRYLLPLVVLFLLATIANATLIGEDAGPLWILLVAFYAWPNIAIQVKRFHDRGMSGWWVLYSLLLMLLADALPVAAILRFAHIAGYRGPKVPRWDQYVSDPLFIAAAVLAAGTWAVFFVILYLLPGQRGVNKYGPDPRGSAA